MKKFIEGRLFLFIVLTLPVLFLLPSLDGFIYGAGSTYSDLAISHFPNALWIQRAIREWGQVPLWSNMILSGYPFAADPLSGLHYPFGWLAYLLPLPFGLNLMALLHLLWGGAGMYLFVRREGAQRWGALLGAVAFEGMPKLFAHLGAGHISLVYACAWLPWLLLGQQKAARSPRRAWMLPGAVLGIIVLADIRLAAIAGLLWMFFCVRQFFGLEARRRKLLPLVAQALSVILLAGAVGAALLLPLLQYLLFSTRGMMTVSDTLSMSLPPARLLGLLIPDMGGTAEWVIYPGSVVLALAMFAWAIRSSRNTARFWWVVFFFSLVWSLGEAIPGMAFIASLPGVSLLRVPPRMMLVGLFALSAGLGLDGMIHKPEELSRLPRVNPYLILVGFTFLSLALAILVWIYTGGLPLRYIWGSMSLIGTLAILFLCRAGKLQGVQVGLVFGLWLLADLIGVNAVGLDFRSKDVVTAEGSSAARYLSAMGETGAFRVYSPSYSIPQQTAVMYGLELADGVDPMQLMSYSQYMRRAGGLPESGYSVTLPPFQNGDPAVDNRAYMPDAPALGLLNVKFVASEFPITADGLELVQQVGTSFIYLNHFALPRAWVQNGNAQIGTDLLSTPEIIRNANRIWLSAQGPGLLVVSDVNYPGWQAYVDGNPRAIKTVAGILRGVDLPPGLHHVEMAFHPQLFNIGAFISLGVVLLVVIAWGIPRRRKHARQV
jgi:hypothetical protein